MKKALFFLLAIPFDLSLILAGVLLSKNILLGGLVGILPAIYLISHGRQTYIGLELPMGIILIAYYAICSFVVYKKTSTNGQ